MTEVLSPAPPNDDPSNPWLEHRTYLDDGTTIHTGWYRWPK